MSTYRLNATGKCYINAVSTAYDSRLPEALIGRLDAIQFQNVIEEINEKAHFYWPCPLCRCFGVLCCPFTLGLSLLCPHVCFSEAENITRRQIDRANEKYFEKHGLELVLIKNCFSSWLQLRETELDHHTTAVIDTSVVKQEADL